MKKYLQILLFLTCMAAVPLQGRMIGMQQFFARSVAKYVHVLPRVPIAAQDSRAHNHKNFGWLSHAKISSFFAPSSLHMHVQHQTTKPMNLAHVVRSFCSFVHQLFFSSTHDIGAELCAHIEQETQSIDVAAYCLTHKEITQKLIDAHKRGVSVRVVIDKSSLDTPGSCVEQLHTAGVPLYVRGANKQGGTRGLMHLKMMRMSGKLFHGSFNFSKAADTVNDESCSCHTDQQFMQAADTEFKRLLSNSKRY